MLALADKKRMQREILGILENHCISKQLFDDKLIFRRILASKCTHFDKASAILDSNSEATKRGRRE